MIHVEEELRAPGGKELTHPEQIDGCLEVTLGLPQSIDLEIILEFLEDNEQLRSYVINRIKEGIHEVLRHLIIQAKQLHPQLVQKVRALRLLNVLFVDDLLETLALRQPKNVLGDVAQIDVLDEGFHHHNDEVLLCVHVFLE